MGHLIVLSAWAGVLLVEVVIERLGERHDMTALAVQAHFWIDVLVELPLVAGVLLTGTVLLARGWPPSGSHVVKLVAAAGAIAINLYCAVIVIVRHRVRDDADAVRRYGRHVRLSVLGVPFGVLAAYLGFVHAL